MQFLPSWGLKKHIQQRGFLQSVLPHYTSCRAVTHFLRTCELAHLWRIRILQHTKTNKWVQKPIRTSTILMVILLAYVFLFNILLVIASRQPSRVMNLIMPLFIGFLAWSKMAKSGCWLLYAWYIDVSLPVRYCIRYISPNILGKSPRISPTLFKGHLRKWSNDPKWQHQVLYMYVWYILWYVWSIVAFTTLLSP